MRIVFCCCYCYCTEVAHAIDVELWVVPIPVPVPVSLLLGRQEILEFFESVWELRIGHWGDVMGVHVCFLQFWHERNPGLLVFFLKLFFLFIACEISSNSRF